MQESTHVAVAVIGNDRQQVLLTRRPDHVHLGGLWEFPGGKTEAGEDAEQALAREIHEELGITITKARPLIRISHAYPGKTVLLDVWRVEHFEGVPYGREGQVMEWVPINELADKSMPAADVSILNAVQLPDCHLITPEPGDDQGAFIRQLESRLVSGIKLIQLRATQLPVDDYAMLANEVIGLARRHGARVLLNQSLRDFKAGSADGLHLNSGRMLAMDERPRLAPGVLLSASCHNKEEVRHANRLGLDFIMLSPVLPTQSHPGAETLGWDGLQKLTELASMPVYALGGMTPADRQRAFGRGAQGIAAIGALWG